MAGLFLLLAQGLVIAVLFAAAYTAWTLTHPPRRAYTYALAKGIAATPQELAPDLGGPFEFEIATFRSRARDLPVWIVNGRSPHGPIGVLTHGWGESRVHALWRLECMAAQCRQVILWDMPGHGEAPGSCSLGALEHEDLLALIDTFAGDEGDRVLLYGASLGAGVSIAAAAQKPDRIAGVIAEAPYRVPRTPAERVLQQAAIPYRVNLPLAMGVLGLVFDHDVTWWSRRGARRFDRAALTARISTPLLVLHGEGDAVCPLEDGRAIAAACAHATLALIPQGAHLDLWVRPEFRRQCTTAVRAWIASSLGQPHNADASR